jgi:hypothetical protein
LAKPALLGVAVWGWAIVVVVFSLASPYRGGGVSEQQLQIQENSLVSQFQGL